MRVISISGVLMETSLVKLPTNACRMRVAVFNYNAFHAANPVKHAGANA